MKGQSRTGKVLAGMLAGLVMFGISVNASAQSDKNVKMTVGAGKLDITSKKNENGCPWYKAREAGCVKADKGKELQLSFLLTGDTKCEQEAGKYWELDAIYLGGYNAKEKPADSGFDGIPQADYDKVSSDFMIADRSSGMVTPDSADDKKITIVDKNEYAYVVWYTVTATCEKSDGSVHTISTDPRIRNGGTG